MGELEMNERDEKSQTLEKELREEIGGLRIAEEEIRKLRQEKESELRNIVLKREAEKVNYLPTSREASCFTG